MKLVNKALLAEKTEFALDCAKRLGADEAEVVASEALGERVAWREGALETIARERDISLALTVYQAQRKGSASISDWSNPAIEEAVKAALTASEYSEADEAAGLPEVQWYAPDNPELLTRLDLYDDSVISVGQMETLAQAMEATAREYDARVVMCDSASAAVYRSQFFMATSNGFAQGYRASRFQQSVSVLAREEQSQQSNYDYEVQRHLADMRSPEAVGQEAARQAVRSLSPQKIDNGRYAVVFDARVAGSLLGYLLHGLSGAMQYRQLSFLNGALGKAVLPEWLGLEELPHLPRAMNSSPFDSDGLLRQATSIVEDGKVASYILDVYSARRLAMQPTANAGGVSNVRFKCATDHIRPPQALYQAMDKGVVVTQLMGQGVNMLTGDYSRGASGFWVEKGEIVCPVEGITIAGNLRDMLAQIGLIGDDVDYRSSLQLPSVLLEQMTVAQ